MGMMYIRLKIPEFADALKRYDEEISARPKEAPVLRVLRRLLEAAASTLPLLAGLFLPIALGVHHLYVWTDAAHHDAVLAEKAVYLNVPFFLVRAVVYFTLWILVAFLLVRGSHNLERSYDPARARRVQLLSGPGLVVYGLGVTESATASDTLYNFQMALLSFGGTVFSDEGKLVADQPANREAKAPGGS